MEFRNAEISDIPVIKKYFDMNISRSCDRVYGSVIMWRSYFNTRLAVWNDTLIISSNYGNGRSYMYPIGKDPDGALKKIEEHCAEKNRPLRFYGLSANQKELVHSKYPDMDIFQDRDWFDYIYDAKQLITLTGKKFAHQRNQINKFLSDYDEWSFEKITAENIEEVKDYTFGFTFGAEKGNSGKHETILCMDVLRHFDEYGMFGGVLKVKNEIVGYSIGEISGDTIFIHIEKATTSFRGAYQMLSNQFLKTFATDEILYVNREEDCGDEGLRRSKMSYNPLFLLEKYNAV